MVQVNCGLTVNAKQMECSKAKVLFETIVSEMRQSVPDIHDLNLIYDVH